MQAVEHALHAVPVGIRLDHGPYTGIARTQPQGLQIRAQGCGVDGGKNRTGHGVWFGQTGLAPRGIVAFTPML